MDSQPSPADESLSDEETARRRDEIVKRMLATPPKPKKPSLETSGKSR